MVEPQKRHHLPHFQGGKSPWRLSVAAVFEGIPQFQSGILCGDLTAVPLYVYIVHAPVYKHVCVFVFIC